jgi:hypothetical protein
VQREGKKSYLVFGLLLVTFGSDHMALSSTVRNAFKNKIELVLNPFYLM